MFLLKNNEKWQNPTYDRTQETIASISHGIGLGASIIGFFALIYMGFSSGNSWLLFSFFIYGVSLMTLYLASTLYHGVQEPHVKRNLRKFDHISIYLLIAGTYTPFMLIGLGRPLGWLILAVVWVMAFLGALWKLFLLGKFEVLAVVGYAVMGAAGLFFLKDLLAALPPETIIWLLIGGAIYILGIIFYAIEKISYNHVIWHFFVMAASLAHFIAVLTLLRK